MTNRTGTDNGALLEGYTQELMGSCDVCDLHLSVKPDVDLDGTFTAFDHDNQEYIRVNGWLWSFEPV